MSVSHDFHLHSSFSADSDADPVSMIEHALSLGLKGICFTEHLDLDCPPEGPDFSLDFDAYFSALLQYKEQYRDRLQIGIGLEFGMQQPHSDHFHSLISRYPFDFIIGSLHFIHGKDPYYPSFFDGVTEEEAYRDYFQELYRLLPLYSGIQTLGHLDYIVRYGPNQNQNYSYAQYADVIDPILTYLIQHEICLEVNTAGLKYGLGATNPSLDVLKRYRSLGGSRITIGSDAHAPEHIAYDFSSISALLSEAGFNHYTVFANRCGSLQPLF